MLTLSSFEPQSSPYHEEAEESTFTLTTSYAGEVASMNLLRQLSDGPAQTPPLTPGDQRPRSRESVPVPVPVQDQKPQFRSSPLKTTESPSRSIVGRVEEKRKAVE